jgi:hypothetical protein
MTRCFQHLRQKDILRDVVINVFHCSAGMLMSEKQSDFTYNKTSDREFRNRQCFNVLQKDI